MKTVCFVGHREEWRCANIEKQLEEVIEKLINQGCLHFFDGNKGAFDALCIKVLLKLKNKYPDIKIFRVLTNHLRKDEYIPSFIKEVIIPEDIPYLHFKQRITKRNEWMIDNADVVVCYIINKIKSGAYKTFLYAKKKNKDIICIKNNFGVFI